MDFVFLGAAALMALAMFGLIVAAASSAPARRFAPPSHREGVGYRWLAD